MLCSPSLKADSHRVFFAFSVFFRLVVRTVPSFSVDAKSSAASAKIKSGLGIFCVQTRVCMWSQERLRLEADTALQDRFASEIQGDLDIFRRNDVERISSEDDFDVDKAVENTTPFASAGIFSKAAFLWLSSILREGYKRPLEHSDIPHLGPRDRSEAAIARFVAEWKNQKGSISAMKGGQAAPKQEGSLSRSKRLGVKMEDIHVPDVNGSGSGEPVGVSTPNNVEVEGGGSDLTASNPQGQPQDHPMADVARNEAVEDEPVDPRTKYEVGALVACIASLDSLYHSAEIVDRRKTKTGVEYYVHYIEYNKRLDEWISYTRLEDWTPDSGLPTRLSMAEKLTPLVIPGTPALTGPGSAENKLDTPGASDRKLTRNLKRRYDELNNVQKGVEELAPIDQTLEKEHEEKTKVKNIQVVEFGKYEIDTWYFSPYPEEYANAHKLYICEFCLKYMKKKKSIQRHKMTCELKHPPGDEIYQTRGDLASHADDPSTSSQTRAAAGRLKPHNISVFEVDGKKSKTYCQNLCLLAKLFLDHKTLYYDVEAFLFYILTEFDEFGHHLVGYFSKEKCSAEDYNLACILTLPPYQRKGYGRFLISFAYELSKKENKIGTPERPLSDLGQVSFRSYWTRVLLEILRDHRGNLSIKDLSSMTAVRNDDIISTLQSLNLIKYWKGQHIISVSAKIIDEHLKNVGTQPHYTIDPTKLRWIPHSFGPATSRRSR
ncbi:hypothetical protein R1flu_019000 [Riccia fluitans]|uniref:histone acetyltransferase n=1 Tax=Riccia fluitans TaxID=41844 RepID=A0ABD1ZIG8_9MARC